MNHCSLHLIAAAAVLALPGPSQAATDPTAPKALERVTVTGGRPSSLPVEIPTTLESITARQIEQQVNATDAQDALKYFPSLLVRKRYIGDYDHAVLASRASGTGNSARSLVYADGVLLSNLLGNGASYTPRWGLVTPEEIERVDVLYGPFSAAYPGNSAGAIVDYVTRSPKAFEAHAKLSLLGQHYQLYGTHSRYTGGQASASMGSREGAFSWWVDVNHLDSDAQPIAFANRLVSAGVAGNEGLPVTGAVLGKNPRNQDWVLFGATSQTHTRQDHAKLKLGYDISPTLRASYTLAWWRNEAERGVESFLRDAAGVPVSAAGQASLGVNVGGRRYTLSASDFAQSRAALEHVTHGLSLKSNTRGTWDWEAAASLYDYARDQVRSEVLRIDTKPVPAIVPGLTDLGGTGWNTLALKGIWRPQGLYGTHIVEMGLQHDAFQLRSQVFETSEWTHGAPGARTSAFQGNTELQSLWAQDAWRFAPAWKAVLGARLEHWTAFNGQISNAGSSRAFAERTEHHVSPKVALSFEASPDWTFKASLGRAVRMPTVAELYQGAISGNVIINNDPALKPEKSWTTELTAERELPAGRLRATFFAERTHDALYSQTNVTVTPNVTNIQNIDAVRTQGLEVALQAANVGFKGLDLAGSVTYADSIITRNDKFPASVGQWQARVPRWRATLLASYAPDEQWSGSVGARYSGKQYGQLDGSDPNGASYTGFSNFFVVDVRLKYRFDKQWSASAGIDNLGNRIYWAFHPYPQRSLNAELRFDY